MHVATISLDLAKSVFQVHDVDGEGRVVVRRRLGAVNAPFLWCAQPRLQTGRAGAGICPLGCEQ